jgi:hypothetical protein
MSKKKKRQQWKYVGRTRAGFYHWIRTDKKNKGEEHWWLARDYRRTTLGHV